MRYFFLCALLSSFLQADIFAQYDKDLNGFISKLEFTLSLYEQKRFSSQWGGSYKKADNFEAYDSNNDGKISFNEFYAYPHENSFNDELNSGTILLY